ncbi:MAG: OmpH family outer membrane protein [Phycisphaerales bacterium]|nr:OmpH family outer membrane protein [Phycisphaerales bacterium]
MKIWFKRNSATLLAIAGICIGLMATLRASALSRKPATPTAVAVVDWIAITDKSAEWKEMQTQLETIGDELEQQSSAMQKTIADLKESVSVLPEGSENRRKEEDKFILESLKYDSWKKFAENKYGSEKALRQVQLYNRITAAVAQVAERDGWDIVLWDDARSKKVDEAKLDAAAELISRRQVFYSRKDVVDITDEVILLMNNEFKAGG